MYRDLPKRCALTIVLAIAFCSPAALGEIIVNDPLPIEYQVQVQLIQTAHDDGSPVATAFGSASERQSIEAGVNQIWAQAGIEIDFVDSITPWNKTTAYNGRGDNNQPTSELTPLLNSASNAGVTSSDSLTLNMVLVNQVPRFGTHSQNSAAGLARINGNGIAQYVGANLLDWQGGRDVISSVVAHEIGHNLGLNHTSTGGDNLMSPSGSSDRLNTSQINSVLSSRFVLPLDTPQPGDYNDDDIVNAADFTLWRDSVAAGDITGSYNEWRENYGTGLGSIAAANAQIPRTHSVPEPSAMWLLLVAALANWRMARQG